MKTALILLLTATAAHAGCGNVYDPMSNRWVYVCSPNPAPQCHNEYDPMNNRWVLVCQ